MWRNFDEDELVVVPAAIEDRVKAAYRDLGARCHLPAGENPVIKHPLMVTGDDAQVFIDLLLADDDGDGNDGAGADGRRVRPRRMEQQMRYMNSLIIGLRRDNADLQLAMERNYALLVGKMSTMNRNCTQAMRSWQNKLRKKIKLALLFCHFQEICIHYGTSMSLE